MTTKIQKKQIRFPPRIPLEKVIKIRNKYDLIELEYKYDEFLNKYCHLLILHELIEEYLDIRDALTIQRQRMEREDKKKMYKENQKMYEKPCDYEHRFQVILPDDLKLSLEQIRQGYMPCFGEPREYKCGCQSIKYYAQCSCKRVSNTCENQKCNEKIYPHIRQYYYCIRHRLLKEKQERLEENLAKIKKELENIKRHSNCFDYNNSLNDKNIRRISRYPWKNI